MLSAQGWPRTERTELRTELRCETARANRTNACVRNGTGGSDFWGSESFFSFFLIFEILNNLGQTKLAADITP